LAKKLKNTDYLFLSPYLRAKENTMLTREKAERMISAKSAYEAGKILEECGYGDMSGVTLQSLGSKINKRRSDVMHDLETVVPDPKILDLFRIKYDYHNLKAAVKAEALGISPDGLFSGAGRYDIKTLKEELTAEDSGVFSRIFNESLLKARDILARTGDPQLSDFVADNGYFEEFAALSEESGSEFLVRYAKLSIDIANLKSVVRGVRMGKKPEFLKQVLADGGNITVDRIISAADGEAELTGVFDGELRSAAIIGDKVKKGGGLTEFERVCDDTLYDMLSEIGFMGYGAEVLIAFICRLESELLDVSIIMSGKLTDTDSETIRARLRRMTD